MATNRDDPALAARPSSQDADEAQLTWLSAARGKIVRVRFLEGKTVTGQLLAFDRATIVLQGHAPTPLLVYTHSIAYLAVDEPGALS
jgi:sRNA-binding regulator protein Hfq